MASSSVYTKKSPKGMDSRKSNSWWWDSHIGPRNTKWLAENLEEMDQNYKRMLKLIEGGGDSFAQKAEMYYQSRPALLSHVDELYRTYKLLAERYELLTGDLRKHLVPDLLSQGSVGFDAGSETNSGWASQDSKPVQYRAGHRAAGFDFFLGSGRSGSDRAARGDEISSVSDSETESDVSSLHSYPGIMANTGEESLVERLMESEPDAHGEGKQQENRNGSLRRIRSEAFDDVHSKIVGYEEELKMANEKIRQSEEDIVTLKLELQKFTSSGSTGSSLHEFQDAGNNPSVDVDYELEVDVSWPEEKIRTLIEELRTTKGRLQVSDKEVIQLRKERRESSENIRKMQDLVMMAQKDAATWKAKLESEKRMASKFQERIARYKTSLNDRENEVRDLKEVISDANRKYQLHAEISRLVDEKNSLEERVREWEVQCQSLEAQHGVLVKKLNNEIENLKTNIAEKTGRLEDLESEVDAYRQKYERLLSEKNDVSIKLSAREDEIVQLGKQVQDMITEDERSRKKAEELREEVERQKMLIVEAGEGKREAIRQLCFTLEHYRNGYKQLRQAFVGEKQLHILAS